MFHIKALVTLSDTAPHPKTEGIRSGYDPHHKFAGVDYLVTGFHTYPDDLVHYPGEQVLAAILFPSWSFFGTTVKVGDVFDVRELDRVVGHGVVQSITPP